MMSIKPFLLEKRPNLLSCTLLLPLIDAKISKEEAIKLGNKFGFSNKTGPLPQTINHVSLTCPSMNVQKNDQESILRIFVPKSTNNNSSFEQNTKVNEYIAIKIDCKIDIERSVLTLHGDHLAARLAFTEFSTARDTRREREIRFPEGVELVGSYYYENGISCRNCHALLISKNVLKSAYQSPRLPWGELIECLTCVKIEDYVKSGTVDKAFVFQEQRVTPNEESVIVAEAHICIQGRENIPIDLIEYSSTEPPLLLNESEENAKSRHWCVACCSNCKCWVGDARKQDNSLKEIRLFKFSIETGEIFKKYQNESVLCGAVLDAALTRECYRFVLATTEDGIRISYLRLILLSYDSWFSSHEHPELTPALKFLYWDCRNEDNNIPEAWADRTGAEWMMIPSKNVCQAIRDSLIKTNFWFPHSARTLPDGSSVGFLFW